MHTVYKTGIELCDEDAIFTTSDWFWPYMDCAIFIIGKQWELRSYPQPSDWRAVVSKDHRIYHITSSHSSDLRFLRT